MGVVFLINLVTQATVPKVNALPQHFSSSATRYPYRASDNRPQSVGYDLLNEKHALVRCAGVSDSSLIIRVKACRTLLGSTGT